MWRSFVVVGLSLVGPQAAPAAGQTAAPPLFRAGSDLVTLNVTVTDGRDREMGGLDAGDFLVLENGKPQGIQFFAADPVPLDVVLLMDTSSSMTEKIEPAREAARRFLRILRPGDRGAVVEFNTQVKILQPFTGDPALLQHAVDTTRPRGNTALYTGLYVALDHFSRLSRGGGEVRKSAIVVLSDGEDTASLIGEDDVRERARRVGVPVYFISLLSKGEEEALGQLGRRRQSTPSDFGMKTLAAETGARAFFPRHLEDLNGVYGAIARELSVQYTLAYAPDAVAADGSFRRVVVRVPGHPDARLRTRSGYYAPGTRASLR